MTDSDMKKNNAALWAVLAVALAIRVALMGATFFPDLFFNVYAPHIAIKNNVFNIYSYMSPKSGERHVHAYYPPLAYYVNLSTQWALLGRDADFHEWLDDYKETRDIRTLDRPGVMRWLFLIKLPFLLTEMFIVFLLLSKRSPVRRRDVMLFWVFNPMVIYPLYVMGQFDIYPALFVLLALISFSGARKASGSIWLGMGAAIKIFPGTLLFLSSIVFGRDIKKSLLYMIIGGAAIVAVTLPLLPSGARPVLESYYLYPGTVATRTQFNPEPYIKLAMFAAVLLFATFTARKAGGDPMRVFVIGAVAVFLSFVALVQFNENYFVWALPLILFALPRADFLRKPAAALFVCLTLSALLFYREQTIATFYPVCKSCGALPGVADWCRDHGVFMPHKIFKPLTKLAAAWMAILCLRDLWRGAKKVKTDKAAA